MKVNITLDTEELKVPDGWEIEGVRVAQRGERYLYWGDVCLGTCPTNGPVVILRKSFNIKDWTCTMTAEEVYGKDFKLPSGYEVIDFRCPRAGDVWIGNLGSISVGPFGAPRFIVKKTG